MPSAIYGPFGENCLHNHQIYVRENICDTCIPNTMPCIPCIPNRVCSTDCPNAIMPSCMANVNVLQTHSIQTSIRTVHTYVWSAVKASCNVALVLSRLSRIFVTSPSLSGQASACPTAFHPLAGSNFAFRLTSSALHLTSGPSRSPSSFNVGNRGDPSAASFSASLTRLSRTSRRLVNWSVILDRLLGAFLTRLR